MIENAPRKKHLAELVMKTIRDYERYRDPWHMIKIHLAAGGWPRALPSPMRPKRPYPARGFERKIAAAVTIETRYSHAFGVNLEFA